MLRYVAAEILISIPVPASHRIPSRHVDPPKSLDRRPPPRLPAVDNVRSQRWKWSITGTDPWGRSGARAHIGQTAVLIIQL